MSAKVIPVIETNMQLRGTGKDESPLRVVRQYWSLDGELLAEVDTLENDRPTPSAVRGSQQLEDEYGDCHCGLKANVALKIGSFSTMRYCCEHAARAIAMYALSNAE